MDGSEERHPKYVFYVVEDERFVDLNVFQMGWEPCKPLKEWGPSIRNHFLFHSVIKGKGRLEMNGEVYHLTAGQGFLICPDVVNMYFADEKDPWEYIWVEFDGLIARECLTLAGLSEKQPIYSPRAGAENNDIFKIMWRILNEADQETIRLVGLGMLFLDELMRTSATKIEPREKKLRDFYIREAIHFIDRNYQRDISVEDVAAACGLNRSYFSRVFKDEIGESPQHFLIHYRMAKAAELLRRSSISVSDVGASVGYENQFRFSRAFKGVFGVSPNEYRKNNRI
jgi:AraC-like DNA-binding protein